MGADFVGDSAQAVLGPTDLQTAGPKTARWWPGPQDEERAVKGQALETFWEYPRQSAEPGSPGRESSLKSH